MSCIGIANSESSMNCELEEHKTRTIYLCANKCNLTFKKLFLEVHPWNLHDFINQCHPVNSVKSNLFDVIDL